MARIPCIREIVTTNWDDFFESECCATPFVYEQDMVYWDKTDRKVLKLHGSINNPGTVVVTSEDYKKRYKLFNTGLIGSQLKLLIANRKIAFIGYSFGDEDFNRVYSLIHSLIGDFIKKPYIITLDKLNDRKWKELGLEPIYTAGEYFLEVIMHKLESKGCFLPAETVIAVQKELDVLNREHIRLAQTINLDQPDVIYCLSYQDGIIHAFDHFLHHINYGESLCKNRIIRTIHGYNSLIKDKKTKKRWFDVAYAQGYLNGYLFTMFKPNTRKLFPRYFDLGLDNELRTYNTYIRSLAISEGRKKTTSKYALKFVNVIPTKNIVVHHPPFL